MFEAIIFSKTHRLGFQTSSAVCSWYIIISFPFSENKPTAQRKVNFSRYRPSVFCCTPPIIIKYAIECCFVIYLPNQVMEIVNHLTNGNLANHKNTALARIIYRYQILTVRHRQKVFVFLLWTETWAFSHQQKCVISVACINLFPSYLNICICL